MDVANDFLYGHIGFDVFIEQLAPSSEKVDKLKQIFNLSIVMFRTKEAEKVWSPMLAKCLLTCDIQQSSGYKTRSIVGKSTGKSLSQS